LLATLGVQTAIGFIRNTLTGPWLDAQDIAQRHERPFRIACRQGRWRPPVARHAQVRRFHFPSRTATGFQTSTAHPLRA